MKPKFTEEERKLIGRRIRDSRNAEKYTLEQLAEIIGCSPKLFFASLFWKKLQTFLENVASPNWRNVHLHGVTDATPWKQTFLVKSY